jgi:hypothetical protein
VGLERAHFQLLGQGQGPAEIISGLIVLRRLATRRNVAEEVQGIRLVATRLVLTGGGQRTLSKGVRFLRAASPQMRLPKGETTEHLKVRPFHRNRLCHRLREHRHGAGDAPGQGLCLAQGCSHRGEYGRAVCFLTAAYGPFE